MDFPTYTEHVTQWLQLRGDMTRDAAVRRTEDMTDYLRDAQLRDVSPLRAAAMIRAL